MLIKKPVVAGIFYPSNPQELRTMLSGLRGHAFEKPGNDVETGRILGGIVPHAGYRYSGIEAARFFHFAGMNKPATDTFVIIHPDHYGEGSAMSVDQHDVWQTPLGSVAVDVEMRKLLDLPGTLLSDSREHSAEVLLPFLQYFLPYDFNILTVSMLEQSIGNARFLGGKIMDIALQLDRRITLLASSDFSHFVDPQEGYYLDGLVIQRICQLDAEGVLDTVEQHDISVCGYGPIMALIFFAKRASEKPFVQVLARGNSGKTNRSGKVVDYVSAAFYG